MWPSLFALPYLLAILYRIWQWAIHASKEAPSAAALTMSQIYLGTFCSEVDYSLLFLKSVAMIIAFVIGCNKFV